MQTSNSVHLLILLLIRIDECWDNQQQCDRGFQRCGSLRLQHSRQWRVAGCAANASSTINVPQAPTSPPWPKSIMVFRNCIWWEQVVVCCWASQRWMECRTHLVWVGLDVMAAPQRRGWIQAKLPCGPIVKILLHCQHARLAVQVHGLNTHESSML